MFVSICAEMSMLMDGSTRGKQWFIFGENRCIALNSMRMNALHTTSAQQCHHLTVFHKRNTCFFILAFVFTYKLKWILILLFSGMYGMCCCVVSGYDV